MKVIFEEKTYREIPESLTIRQSDDAWHPLKDRNYIEWWYFDVMNSDGSLLRGQFYIRGDVSRPGKVKVGVRASYVKTDGTEIVIEEKFPYSSFKSSTEACEVEIGRNYLKGDLSHCKLHIEDGEKALDLELDSEIKGITGHACFGDETKYMFWVVPQPRGHARGTFRTREKTFDIEGVGYRDHNWLNFFPLNVIAHWDWGRIYDKEFTVIFADILTTKRLGDSEIKPLAVYDSRKLIYLTSESKKFSLAKRDTKFDRDRKIEYPETYILKAQDEDLSLEINLKLGKVFQKIDLLADYNPLARLFIRTFKAKPVAMAFFSTGSGKLSFSGQQKTLACTAIHELVRNR